MWPRGGTAGQVSPASQADRCPCQEGAPLLQIGTPEPPKPEQDTGHANPSWQLWWVEQPPWWAGLAGRCHWPATWWSGGEGWVSASIHGPCVQQGCPPFALPWGLGAAPSVLRRPSWGPLTRRLQGDSALVPGRQLVSRMAMCRRGWAHESQPLRSGLSAWGGPITARGWTPSMCPTTHVTRGPLGVIGEGTRLPSPQPLIPLRPQEGPPPLLPGGPLPPFLAWAQVTLGFLVAFGCLCKPGSRPRLGSEATGPWAASPFFLFPVWRWGVVPTSAGDPLGTPAFQVQQHPGWSETWSWAPSQTDQSQITYTKPTGDSHT